ncbi:DUF3718 domain-containing protein [Aliiglaciecola aliphaticivorans]
MIKTLLFVFAIFLVTLFYASNAKANINVALKNLCSLVASDDTSTLQQKITEMRTHYRLKLQHYYDGISCDGQSLIRTALLNKANHTAELLIEHLPKRKLRMPEHDGKTLLQWINETEFAGSPIANTLGDKI